MTGWTSARALLLGWLAAVLTIDAPLELAGVGSETAVAVADLAVAVYALVVVVRLFMVDEPLAQALPAVAALILVIGAVAAFGRDYGVRVESAHFADFYGSVAQVAATLLVALAFTAVRWGAPRADSLVVLSALLLIAALASSLVALGLGHDSVTLFSFSVAGLVLGVLMAGVGAILTVTSKRNDDFEHDTPSSASEDRPAAGPGSRTVEGSIDPATMRRSKAGMALMGAAISAMVLLAVRGILGGRRR